MHVHLDPAGNDAVRSRAVFALLQTKRRRSKFPMPYVPAANFNLGQKGIQNKDVGKSEKMARNSEGIS